MEDLEEIMEELIALGLASVRYEGDEAFFRISPEGAAYLEENGYNLTDGRTLH
jgi:hypothetical protein